MGRLPFEGSRVVVDSHPQRSRLQFPRSGAKIAKTIMDLADASLIVAAERLSTRRIFTLDSDFYISRPIDGSTPLCVP